MWFPRTPLRATPRHHCMWQEIKREKREREKEREKEGGREGKME